MNKFKNFSSLAIPLNIDNVDTDAIIPKQYLKSIKKSGFGDYLFDQWRYTNYAELGDDCSNRPKNNSFVLNDPTYKNSNILIAKNNFGCGSSREHAVWALRDYNIKVVIAISFADIFANNCIKNGLLPITLDSAIVNTIFEHSPVNISIDLRNQQISCNNKKYNFEISSANKKRLLEGLDDIDLTLKLNDKIENFENAYFNKYMWLKR